VLFAVLVCVFLWRPIFTGRALLPGDYLAQMAPWKTVDSRQSSVVSQDSQHPELVEGSGNPGPQWNPLQWDAISQFYPWRVFYARSMRSGSGSKLSFIKVGISTGTPPANSTSA